MNPKDPKEAFAEIRALSPYFARIQDDKTLALELAKMEGHEDDPDEYVRKEYGYEIPRVGVFSHGLTERVGASATAGFGPKLANAAAAGAVALFSDDSFDDAYATMQQWSEERMQTYQEDNPGMAMAGDFAGGVVGALAGGAALKGAGGLLSRVAGSTAAGAVPAASMAGRGLDAMGALGRGMQALPGTLPGQMALGGAEAAAYHTNMGGDSPLTAAAMGMMAPAAARGVFSGIAKLKADRAARAAQEAAPRPPGGPGGPPPGPGGPPPGAAPGGPPPGPGGPPPAPTPGGPPPGLMGRAGQMMEEAGNKFEHEALKGAPTLAATLGHAAKVGLTSGVLSGNPGLGATAALGRLAYGATRAPLNRYVATPVGRALKSAGQKMQNKPPINPDIASTVGSKIDDGAARVPTQKTVPWSDAEIEAAVMQAERSTMPPGAGLPRPNLRQPAPPVRLPQSTLGQSPSPFDAVDSAVAAAIRSGKAEAALPQPPASPSLQRSWADAVDNLNMAPARLPDVNPPRGTAPTVRDFPSLGRMPPPGAQQAPAAPRAAPPPPPPAESPILRTVDAAAERRAIADQIRAERVKQIKDTKARGLSRSKIEKAVRAEAEAMVKSGELADEAARKAWVRKEIIRRAEEGSEGYKLAKGKK